MNFSCQHIYHLYNRGNDAQPVFYSRNNYLLFLSRLNTYILPYADVLSWCLLPNHFHLMLYVKETELEFKEEAKFSYAKRRSLSSSVFIMLCSYTRAVQKRITDNFIQQQTEAVCLTDTSGIIPLWYLNEYGTGDQILYPEKEYPELCFNYIHNAPVKNRLVKTPDDWEFSSYQDVTGKRNGKLINRDRIRNLGLNQYQNEPETAKPY